MTIPAAQPRRWRHPRQEVAQGVAIRSHRPSWATEPALAQPGLVEGELVEAGPQPLEGAES